MLSEGWFLFVFLVFLLLVVGPRAFCMLGLYTAITYIPSQKVIVKPERTLNWRAAMNFAGCILATICKYLFVGERRHFNGHLKAIFFHRE